MDRSIKKKKSNPYEESLQWITTLSFFHAFGKSHIFLISTTHLPSSFFESSLVLFRQLFCPCHTAHPRTIYPCAEHTASILLWVHRTSGILACNTQVSQWHNLFKNDSHSSILILYVSLYILHMNIRVRDSSRGWLSMASSFECQIFRFFNFRVIEETTMCVSVT